MSHSYRDLTSKTTDELITEHDKLAASTQIGVNYYLDELRRRSSDELANEMNRLTIKIASMTKRIELLTWVAALCGIVGVVIAVVGVVIAVVK